MSTAFDQHFARLAGLPADAGAHAWQSELALGAECCNRLIRIPTGMGKTFGVLAAWSFHRLTLRKASWPRRLVWCLPMRTLVEQVAAEVSAALAREVQLRTERVLGLLRCHGPFALAWMAAVTRAADQRASRDATLSDPALEPNNADHGLATEHSRMARLARSREAAPRMGRHSGERGAQHGLRGRASGSDDAGSGTCPPAHATRCVEARLGTLNYQELAPHLAQAAKAIESVACDGQALHEDLLLQLHQRLCAALTPQLTGWRRAEVLVGTHAPPASHRVPLLLHEYALDLQARLAAAGADRGMVFHNYTLFPWLSALDSICFGVRECGLPRAEPVQAATESSTRWGSRVLARRNRVRTVGSRRMELSHFQALGSAPPRLNRLVLDYPGRSAIAAAAVFATPAAHEVSLQRMGHCRDSRYLDGWCHLRGGRRGFTLMGSSARVQVLAMAAIQVAEDELDRALGLGYGILAVAEACNGRFCAAGSTARVGWAHEVWHPVQCKKRQHD